MNVIKNSLSQTRYCFYKIIFPSMQERRHRDSGSLEFESRMCNRGDRSKVDVICIIAIFEKWISKNEDIKGLTNKI